MPAFLTTEMHNGASVKDWLGTAACAARVGAMLIEDVRSGAARPHLIERDLTRAAAELEQAATELRQARDRVPLADA